MYILTRQSNPWPRPFLDANNRLPPCLRSKRHSWQRALTRQQPRLFTLLLQQVMPHFGTSQTSKDPNISESWSFPENPTSHVLYSWGNRCNDKVGQCCFPPQEPIWFLGSCTRFPSVFVSFWIWNKSNLHSWLHGWGGLLLILRALHTTNNSELIWHMDNWITPRIIMKQASAFPCSEDLTTEAVLDLISLTHSKCAPLSDQGQACWNKLWKHLACPGGDAWVGSGTR